MDINARTQFCGVIGNPVEHSLSPAIHNAAFQKLGLNFVYLAWQVEMIGDAIKGLRALGNFRGASVTIPHKVTAVPFLDDVESTARHIGAINTIVSDKGRLTGYNTDATGALRALHDGGAAGKGQRVVMLGSGGAARAIAFALAAEGAIERLDLLGIDDRERKTLTMLPVYGLAEATVGVSFSPLGPDYERVVMDRHSLQIGAPYSAVDPQHEDAVSFLKVGKAIRDVEIRIADDDDTPLEDGRIGNILLRGGSVTERIYGDPEATAELFTEDGWLRTGDCGVFVDGDLVITGRQKDIIIINGQNYYPHDIEEIVAQLDELDLNKVVVAGATPKGGQTEELIAFILHRQDIDDFRPLIDKVRNIVGEHAGIEVHTVVPVPRIPKTTSGKVQRAKLLAAYADGEFDAVLSELAPAEDAAAGPADENPLVAELVEICREVAKDRKIGADDNLFEVGVSSLTLTEVVLAVDERYPGKLDISDLFDYPTLREIAAFIERKSE